MKYYKGGWKIVLHSFDPSLLYYFKDHNSDSVKSLTNFRSPTVRMQMWHFATRRNTRFIGLFVLISWKQQSSTSNAPIRALVNSLFPIPPFSGNRLNICKVSFFADIANKKMRYISMLLIFLITFPSLLEKNYAKKVHASMIDRRWANCCNPTEGQSYL